MKEQLPSNPLTKLIERVSARIPASVTPSTRIEIHPSEWLLLVDAVTADEPEAAPEELTERLLAEADLCRNDGATDIAKLLEDAAKQNEVHWRTRRTLLRQLESTAQPPSAAPMKMHVDREWMEQRLGRTEEEHCAAGGPAEPPSVDASAVMLRALDRIEEEASCEEVDPDDCRETIIRLAREAIDIAKGRTTVTKGAAL